MTALDAFLPTTAALHRHLAAETEPEPTPDRKDPVLTKYIVVATKSGHEVPILAPQVDGLNHSDLVPDNCTPVSAGFAMFARGQVIILPNMGSLTLNLDPRPQDKRLIANLLNS